MRWHESVNFFDFPGHTLYHGGFWWRDGGEKPFFVGDSFTPSGIDDYCLQNRDFRRRAPDFCIAWSCWTGSGRTRRCG